MRDQDDKYTHYGDMVRVTLPVAELQLGCPDFAWSRRTLALSLLLSVSVLHREI